MIIDRTVAASSTNRAIGPTVSCLLEKGMTKSRGVNPVVGRIVTTLFRSTGPTGLPKRLLCYIYLLSVESLI